MTALDRSAVEATLQAAEAAHVDATRKLATAREQLAHVEAKLDESQTEAARKAVSYAKLDVESAERVEKKRGRELETARSTMRRLVREEQTAAFTAAKAKLAELPQLLSRHGERLVSLDREVGVAVLAVVHDVASAMQTFDEAKGLAEELGETTRFGRDFQRPTVANARLACARFVTMTRLDDTPARAPVAPAWLEHVPDALHWKAADQSAEQLADAQAFAAREAVATSVRAGTVRDAVVALQGATLATIPPTATTTSTEGA